MNGLRTLLFFDDWELNYRENLIRHVGKPELVPEGTFEDPYTNVTWSYPTVFCLSGGEGWRCLYQGHSQDDSYILPLVAESKDGIRWEVPDLSEKIPLPGRIHPHQIIPSKNFRNWCCYVDERAKDPSERIKGLVAYHDPYPAKKTRLAVSPDGLSWKQVEGAKWSPDHLVPDPPWFAFWNHVRSSYVITLRPMGSDRRVALVETKDWRTFTEPELALQPDALDSPLAEFYGMRVFPYEGIFVGLLWIFHPTPKADERKSFRSKYLHGKVDCQLTYSKNGWHFQRTLREPLFSNEDLSQFGGGCIYPSSMIMDDKKCIRVYSGASKPEHGILKKGSGALLLHRLRLDGFIYLETGGGPGLLGTRPLLWRKGEVQLNIEAPWGEGRVQVTDPDGRILEGYRFKDCVPFTGDELFWEPQWRGGRCLDSLAGKLIRLEVQMYNARIYAIRGGFLAPAEAKQAKRFEHCKERPEVRLGF